MTETLLDIVRRHVEAHADADGIALTPIAGLTTIRAKEPTGILHAIARPLVCLVLEGAKQVAIGASCITYRPGDSLLITADVPIISQITLAPYTSLVLDLDPAVLSELAGQMIDQPAGAGGQAGSTDADVADTALRLMRLLDRPGSVPVLHAQLVRELHYWLLAGRHGTAIRRLGGPDGHAQRIARAVTLLRAEFDRPLPVERLAALAGMSASSFHHHFRAATSLSPLQFQKHLRLIEARRRMLSDGVTASSAAFAVGYESVSQFTREYGRMFGLPPMKDAAACAGRIDAPG